MLQLPHYLSVLSKEQDLLHVLTLLTVKYFGTLLLVCSPVEVMLEQEED
jgi:hypothetical protein